ncbi:MAG TPA: hypothetical protein VIY28_13890 [Pseudonocardiaceae bacterium]
MIIIGFLVCSGRRVSKQRLTELDGDLWDQRRRGGSRDGPTDADLDLDARVGLH